MNRVVTPPCVRSDVPAERRFALGTTPDYNMSTVYSDGPRCWVDLLPGPVVRLRDGMPVLVDEGRFHGMCGGSPMRDAFESVRVAQVSIRQLTQLAGLHRGELDSRRPDTSAAFRVFAADACGEDLRTGRRPNGRWSLHGCSHIVQLIGTHSPRDEIELAPRSPGTCRIDVEFLGATTSMVVNVR